MWPSVRRILTQLLLNEGVVCERNPPLPNSGLSSLQNELTNWLQVGKSIRKSIHLEVLKKGKLKKKSLWERHSDCDSPPGNVGLHYLHHGHRGLVDFDKGPTEALSQSQRVDDFHHFRTDALDTVSGQSVISLTKKVILVQLFYIFTLHIEIFQISILLIWMIWITS